MSVVLHKGTNNQVKLEFEDLKENDILTEVRNQTLMISLHHKVSERKKWYKSYKVRCIVT